MRGGGSKNFTRGKKGWPWALAWFMKTTYLLVLVQGEEKGGLVPTVITYSMVVCCKEREKLKLTNRRKKRSRFGHDSPTWEDLVLHVKYEGKKGAKGQPELLGLVGGKKGGEPFYEFIRLTRKRGGKQCRIFKQDVDYPEVKERERKVGLRSGKEVGAQILRRWRIGGRS